MDNINFNFNDATDGLTNTAPPTLTPSEQQEHADLMDFDFDEFLKQGTNQYYGPSGSEAISQGPTDHPYVSEPLFSNNNMPPQFIQPSQLIPSTVREPEEVQQEVPPEFQQDPFSQVQQDSFAQSQQDPFPQFQQNQAFQLDMSEDYVYRNYVLNNFQNPKAPLQIIDQVLNPFPDIIQQALEQEVLVNMLKSEINKEPKREAGKPSGIVKQKKTPQNKRSANIQKAVFDAEKYYKIIPTKPSAWGAITESGELPFQYTTEGELIPGRSYTVDQIIEYLSKHPLHDNVGEQNHLDTRSGLKLWIQRAPADGKQRYPSEISDICRFKNCPISNRTITKGLIRVCLDEQTHPNFPKNPYHNAGYVHLYCLEKSLDFPQLCKDFRVLPDTRQLLEPTNMMAINKDHGSMEKIVEDFTQNSKPWAKFDDTQVRPAAWYEHSLNYQLVTEHLGRQSRSVQTVREKRDGNSLDVHKGNLDLYIENQRILKAKKTPRAKAGGTGTPNQKRKRESEFVGGDEDAEFELDDDILELNSRPIKKRRTRSNPTIVSRILSSQ